ncbi:hypothetical protein KUTeg_004272 [Tegillarca granosa]|uniref:Uncharacterized protein n=1 Tax=Tegillarca granosa TaxID=220873 RepID=A0ABQ9FSN3_TEGGR|nr:hypothetical protein KUTeg_004272 [Tegillarca granosa]
MIFVQINIMIIFQINVGFIITNAKLDIAEILGHKDTKIISDENLSALVRQIAVNCDLASLVLQRQHLQPQDPFASNWLERLRKIKQIRSKALSETEGHHSPNEFDASRTRNHHMHLDDFTEYV